jgi:hypothetical protein
MTNQNQNQNQSTWSKQQICLRGRAAALLMLLRRLHLLHYPVGSLPVWVNSRKSEQPLIVGIVNNNYIMLK